MAKIQWRPPQTGNENWRQVWDAIYSLKTGQNNITTVINQLPPQPTFQQIANQLQQGGQAQLNVTGLPGSQAIFAGTHALRLSSYSAGAYPNTLFFETDRQALYASVGASWLLVVGRMNATQAQLTGLGLGTGDTGMLVDVTDFAHVLQWTGSAFNYADPTDPPGRIIGFLVDPTGNGWVFCNGTNTTYLQGNGTLSGNVTLPNFAGNNFAYLAWANNANATFLATGPANNNGNALELRPWFRR